MFYVRARVFFLCFYVNTLVLQFQVTKTKFKGKYCFSAECRLGLITACSTASLFQTFVFMSFPIMRSIRTWWASSLDMYLHFLVVCCCCCCCCCCFCFCFFVVFFFFVFFGGMLVFFGGKCGGGGGIFWGLLFFGFCSVFFLNNNYNALPRRCVLNKPSKIFANARSVVDLLIAHCQLQFLLSIWHQYELLNNGKSF